MGRERQRGAIGIMAAGTLLLALICLALVIDTGRLYYEQRKLQRVADMAALEAAAQSGMCGSQSTGQITAFALASAASNGFVPGTADTLAATLGTVGFSSDNTRREFTAGGALADSVEVQAVHTVPSSLVLNVASLFSGASAQTRLSARAVARRTAMAGISAGSGVLSLSSGNSALLNALLGGLLGTGLNLDLVTYQGIAGANISLLALSEQLQAAGVNLELGKIDSLLDAKVTAVQLLDAMVNAADGSQLAGADAALLRTGLASINVPGAQLTLRQLISVVAPGSVRDGALNANVNLFDLLMATAMVANQGHALTIPTQKMDIPGLITQELSIDVISPPQIAIGYPGRNPDGSWRTQAYSSQVDLTLKASSDLLGLGLVKADVTLGANVARGYAALDSIKCAGIGKPVEVTVQAHPGLASLSLNASVKALTTPAGYLASATAKTPSGPIEIVGPGEIPLTFEVDDPSKLPSDVQRTQTPLGASLADALDNLNSKLDIDVELGTKGLLCEAPLVGWLLCSLGDLVDSLAGVVLNSVADLEGLLTTALAELVKTLGMSLIDPLLELLGIQTGILDVRLIDLQTSSTELLI